jgi:hypothetical protein
MTVFHPDMVWPWPRTPQSHDPMDWVIEWGRYDYNRWKSGWQSLFDTHRLAHNQREIKKIKIFQRGRRRLRSGRYRHSLGRRLQSLFEDKRCVEDDDADGRAGLFPAQEFEPIKSHVSSATRLTQNSALLIRASAQIIRASVPLIRALARVIRALARGTGSGARLSRAVARLIRWPARLMRCPVRLIRSRERSIR